MMRRPISIVVASALLAGCGGGDGQDGGTTDGPQSQQTTERCTSLTAEELARIASVRSAKQQSLANAPGQTLRCSTLFVDSSGQLILELTEADGDRTTLADLRQAAASDLGPAAVRPLPALGPGAFIARRVLAFASDGAIVKLQTGYGADGRLQVSPSQLRRLAAIVGAPTGA